MFLCNPASPNRLYRTWHGLWYVLHANGYGIWWALVMSLFIYAGSMQYLTVSLLTSGASLIAAAITTLMVNARHLFYGISMIDKYKGAGRKKPYMIFSLTDETYSLVCSAEFEDEKEWLSTKKHAPAVIYTHQHCGWHGVLYGVGAGSILKKESDFNYVSDKE